MRRQPSYQPARHDDEPATAHLHSQRLKVGHVGLSQTSQSGMAVKTRGNPSGPWGNHNAPFTEAGYMDATGIMSSRSRRLCTGLGPCMACPIVISKTAGAIARCGCENGAK